MRSCLIVGLLVTLALPAHAQVLSLLKHQDFEEDRLEWTKWPEDTGTTMGLDATVAQHGRQSLRVTATRTNDRLFACAPTALFEGGALYRITVHIRRDGRVSANAIGFRINWRAGEGEIKDRSTPASVSERRLGDWTARIGYVLASKIEPHAQFMLSVENAVGTVWFDNIIIEKIGDPSSLPVDLWTNQMMGVETGSGPLARYRGHQEARDRVYQMGEKYNALVFANGLLERDLRDLQRCLGYAGREPDKTLADTFTACDEQLNAAYLAYIKAFRSQEDADWDAFGALGDRVKTSHGLLKSALDRNLAALRPAQPVTLPPHLGRQPQSVKPFEPNGRMNRLLLGCWSPTEFSDWEKPLDLEFHSSAPGAPKVHTETEVDFSNITKACDDLEKLGYKGTFGYLEFGIHQSMYAPQWLVDKHKDETDFFRVSQDGLKGQSQGNSRSLNYFHPAVRAYVKDYLTQYATFCKNEPRVLFYETSQEAYPYFTVDGKARQTGYGPHAEAAFRKWLADKYRTIAALNQAWGSSYAGFDTITPPPDAYLGRKEVTPLVAEFEAFRDDSYTGYLKLIYDSLKAADPAKPVVARHSSLLHLINGARLFETCDVLSFHRGAPQMDMGSVYLNSLNRFHKRGLGYMEDFWGLQEEAGRSDDERAQRRGLEKHVARTLTWGRTLQLKWYSYTTGAYIFDYRGNWFNPQWDLTTVRYCTPGLAVAKQQMEKLDWVLTHSEIVPSQALVLQPSASMRNERDISSYATMLDLHGALYQKGVLYELLPEEYFEDGRAKFGDFKVVILPNVKYLSADLQRKLVAFLRQGTLLIFVGQVPVRDELGRPCRVLADALGKEAESGVLFRGMRSFEAQGGHCQVIPDLAGVTDYMDLPKMVWSYAVPAAAGYYLTENVLRVTEEGDRYLFSLNPNVDRAVTNTVQIRGEVKRAVDVTAPGGFPVPVTTQNGRSAVKLRLGPGETAVIWLGKPGG